MFTRCNKECNKELLDRILKCAGDADFSKVVLIDEQGGGAAEAEDEGDSESEDQVNDGEEDDVNELDDLMMMGFNGDNDDNQSIQMEAV